MLYVDHTFFRLFSCSFFSQSKIMISYIRTIKNGLAFLVIVFSLIILLFSTHDFFSIPRNFLSEQIYQNSRNILGQVKIESFQLSRQIISESRWEYFTRTGNPLVYDGVILTENEIFELEDLFRNKSLWAGSYENEREAQETDRFLLQQLWSFVGFQIYPQLFNSQKRKKIGLFNLSPSFVETIGGEGLLVCPADWNFKCELNSQVTEGMDAIVVHVDYALAKVPDIHPNSKTLRIFQTWQSPFHSLRKVFGTGMSNSRDLLASYWRGSDIQVPYGKWVNFDPQIRSKNQFRNYSEGKSKMVAIFTSNCNPRNGRLSYVTELAKWIQVDIYGKCGNNTCEKKHGKTCFQNLMNNYRFYLAFENSNCRDYISEKLFLNAFQYNLIPIVMGAHPDDYKSMAPPNSFISIEDFENPRDLAEYLKKVAGSGELYNSYFQWKGTGKFVDTEFICRICALLFYRDLYPPPSRRFEIHWEPGSNSTSNFTSQMCLPEKKWYWREKRTPSSNLSALLE